jgi:hypothetical protein
MHRSYAMCWDTIQLKSQNFQVERPHLLFLRYEERATRPSRPDYSNLGMTAATYADPRYSSHIVAYTWPMSLDEKT